MLDSESDTYSIFFQQKSLNFWLIENRSKFYLYENFCHQIKIEFDSLNHMTFFLAHCLCFLLITIFPYHFVIALVCELRCGVNAITSNDISKRQTKHNKDLLPMNKFALKKFN